MRCPSENMRIPPRFLVPAVLTGVVVPAMVLMMTSFKSNINEEELTIGISTIQERQQSLLFDQAKFQELSNWWHQHVKTQCKKFKLPDDVQDLGVDLDHILVNDEHKLLYCQIPKVATTNWRRVFIGLSGKVDPNTALTISSNDVHHKYDQYLTYLGDMTTEEINYRLKNYFKFVFVREPFERLLSAFRNKFVTQTASAIYFKNIFEKKIIDAYRTKPLDLDNPDGLKFEEFLSYLSDPNRKIKMNEHWDRFHQLCHPCLIDYDFVGRLDRVDVDSKYVLEKSGLIDKVKFPTRAEAKYSAHKTHDYMTEYFSNVPTSVLKKVYRAYEADFAIFNFTVPPTILTMLQKDNE